MQGDLLGELAHRIVEAEEPPHQAFRRARDAESVVLSNFENLRPENLMA
jgi:hypothetical protein